MLTLAEHGTGRPVVLLNPFPFDTRIWADNVSALVARGLRVFTIDYPGFSPSATAWPARRLSIDGIADSVVSELDQRGVPAAAYVGVSMGGYVALSIATRFPARANALVLADTRATGDSPTARAGREAALATLANPTEGVEAYLTGSLGKLVAPDASDEIRARVRTLAVTHKSALVAGIQALRDRHDRTPDLATLSAPTLVLVGAGDQISPPDEMRGLAAAIKGATFHEIAGAGHLTLLEQPAVFNRLVGDFLAPRK